MNRQWFFLIAGCLILGFQNCSQNAVSTSMASDGSSFDQINSGGRTAEGISEDSGSSGSGLTAVTAVEIYTMTTPLTVVVATGKVVAFDSSGATVEKNCLTSDDLAELNSYISTYSLCGAPPPETTEACAQTYTRGYANLVMGNIKVALGESRDSCGTGYKDFCNEQGIAFREFTKYVQDSCN